MKKSILPLLALLVIVVAIWATYFRPSGTTREELKDFAVKDTARITRIFLSDRSGQSILLMRSAEKGWLVNDSIKAKHETTQYLLNVIYRVSVKNRVFHNSYNTIIKDLASRGIKCEIYLDGHRAPDKVYYVGGPTPDALGTYMMLENSSVPFVTEIPGFNGYLTPWYPTRLENWKDNIVFSYRPEEIKQITIDYPTLPSRSFSLEKREDVFFITSASSNTTYPVKDTFALSNYLTLLRSVPFEGIDKLNKDSYKDSLSRTIPLVTYSITDTRGNDVRIRIHPMPLNDYSLTREDSLGTPLKYDVDRMLAYMENTKQWVTIQHFAFDPILRSFQDFMSSDKQSTIDRHLPR